VIAMTAPALYIATTVVGGAPSPRALGRAIASALGGFGFALAGSILPVAFVSLSSLEISTTLVATTAALAAAALMGFARLRVELRAVRANETPRASFASWCVLIVWGVATAGIAGRFWLDLAHEVLS
jgi:hypothetical protein